MKSQIRNYLGAQLTIILFYHGTMLITPIPPKSLPLWGLDRILPYNDFFGLAYISFFFLILYAIAGTSVQTSTKGAKAVILCGLLAIPFFLLYPTVYTREIPAEQHTPLLFFIKSLDKRFNCFPSLHIAISVVCCYYGSRHKKWIGKLLFLIWLLLLCLSVVSTGQHYTTDVIGGCVLGLVSIIITDKTRSISPIPSYLLHIKKKNYDSF